MVKKILALACIAVALTACGGGGTDEDLVQKVPAPTAIPTPTPIPSPPLTYGFKSDEELRDWSVEAEGGASATLSIANDKLVINPTWSGTGNKINVKLTGEEVVDMTGKELTAKLIVPAAYKTDGNLAFQGFIEDTAGVQGWFGYTQVNSESVNAGTETEWKVLFTGDNSDFGFTGDNFDITKIVNLGMQFDAREKPAEVTGNLEIESIAVTTPPDIEALNANGGFETAVVGEATAAGWFFQVAGGAAAEFSIIDDMPADGANALQVEIAGNAGTAEWNVQSVIPSFPIEADVNYTFSGKINGPAGKIVNSLVQLAQDPYSGLAPTLRNVIDSDESTYQRVVIDFTSSEAVTAQAAFQFGGPLGNEDSTFKIDSALIVPSSTPVNSNGSFEAGDVGPFEGGGTGYFVQTQQAGISNYERKTGCAFTGEKCIQVNIVSTPSLENPWWTQVGLDEISVRADVAYEYIVHLNGSPGTRVDIRVQDPNNGFAELGNVIQLTLDDDESTYQQFVYDLTYDRSAAVSAVMQFNIDGNAGKYVHIDEVTFRPVQIPAN